ncbi:MAG TPA: hypothetical protein VIA45_01500 [Thermoanaerobaculia bacterium]|jgi:hypothetical protein
MSHDERVQEKIDAYLMELRRRLGELPEGEVGTSSGRSAGTFSSAPRRTET